MEDVVDQSCQVHSDQEAQQIPKCRHWGPSIVPKVTLPGPTQIHPEVSSTNLPGGTQSQSIDTILIITFQH